MLLSTLVREYVLHSRKSLFFPHSDLGGMHLKSRADLIDTLFSFDRSENNRCFLFRTECFFHIHYYTSFSILYTCPTSPVHYSPLSYARYYVLCQQWQACQQTLC